MEQNLVINLTKEFKAESLLDLSIPENQKIHIDIIYDWEKPTDELEKCMIFFYNKIMDDKACLEMSSDMRKLTTAAKVETLRVMLNNIDFLSDESIIETIYNLTRTESVQEAASWSDKIFNDVVEYVDIKLELAEEVAKVTRSMIIYYMSLFAQMTGNRIMHNSNLTEMFLVTRKGIPYYGELLTSFGLSALMPINGEELYIVQNGKEILDGMILSSSVLNNLELLGKIIKDKE